MARAWSVVFAALYVLLTAAASWFLFLVVTFPWENQDPGDAAADDVFVGIAFAMFVSAALVFFGVVSGRVWIAAPALAVGAVAGLATLLYATEHWSDHADLLLGAFAVATAGTGPASVLLTPGRRRSTRG